MRFLIFIFAAAIAAPAWAKDPFVSEWNGYSLSVSFAASEETIIIPPQSVSELAGSVCRSVGKPAELQVIRKEAPFRFSAFYICV